MILIINYVENDYFYFGYVNYKLVILYVIIFVLRNC